MQVKPEVPGVGVDVTGLSPGGPLVESKIFGSGESMEEAVV